jgi:hypothetical protein
MRCPSFACSPPPLPPNAQGPLPALQEANINHFWFSCFAAVSSFNNVGFSLLNDNYTQVADRPGVLLLMCLYIIAGNTGLPVFLRAIFGTLGMLRPKNRAIRFVLDNPRCALTLVHACASRGVAVSCTPPADVRPTTAAARLRSSTPSSPWRWPSSCAATC